MPAVIGLDVGTSGVKGVLLDSTGRVASQASASYETDFPRRGWAEQDPDDWWSATCTVLRTLMGSAQGSQIDGLAISSQAPALVPLGENGRWIRPALIWMDRRATEESKTIVRSGEFGHCDPYFLAPKVLWMKFHEPELFSRVRSVVQVNGYIVFRLTGAQTMDVTHGGLTLLWDPEREDWDAIKIAQLDLPPDIWPRVVEAVEVAEGVSPEASRQTGIPSGVPVFGGAIDAVTAALATGAGMGLEAVEMTGTSSVLAMRDHLASSPPEWIRVRYFEKGVHLLLAPMVAGGGGLKWAARVFVGERTANQTDAVYAALEECARKSRPGACGVLFHPYLLGERSPIWNPFVRGSFSGLSFQSTRDDLIRSIYEGIAFALRHNLERIDPGGVLVRELWVTGGSATSRFWNQLKADITGRRVRCLPAAPGSAYGAAVLAGIGAGYWKDAQTYWQHAGEVPGEVFNPSEISGLYDEAFARYKAFCEKLIRE
ncbi:FGGY family carbohydrate kinase [Kyrpidia sp.]|uniref:xylulokinase n=1 Tax=Kyrpidia sp. TaxID=2073077 RepID=UPI001837F00E|nr:FGGY family carbohydrate kinase [Kyrpidia sp.]MCL6575003.1 hypothetical protein [Kyrpidia sp.]HHY66191.1 hypothetical protein [Alicyclobacillus sp.]